MVNKSYSIQYAYDTFDYKQLGSVSKFATKITENMKN